MSSARADFCQKQLVGYFGMDKAKKMITTLSSIPTYLIIRSGIFLVVVLGALLWVGNAYAAAQIQEANGQTLLVHFAEGTTPEVRDAVIAETGGWLVKWMPQINVAEVYIPVMESAGIASLPASASGIVTYAEEDAVVEGAAVYNDIYLADESMRYGLVKSQALEAWNVVTGSQEIIIAIIDSGIKLDHPEFAGRLTPGYDFVNDNNEPDDDHGHGTHVAGIAGAALGNGIGLAGVCPNCRLMPIKVLNENNVGAWSNVAQGILYAVDNGAHIINLSLGATTHLSTLEQAIQYALDHGVIVMAAAGNLSSDAPFYPAALDGVIGVGATNSSDGRWLRSNFGSFVDITAPGSLIFSTYHDLNNTYQGYTFMSGTSMATPFVSGVAGLLLSANPELTAEQVTEAIFAGAEDFGTPGWDPEYGHGRIRALETLKLAVDGLRDYLDSEQLAKEASPAPFDSALLYLPSLSNN